MDETCPLCTGGRGGGGAGRWRARHRRAPRHPPPPRRKGGARRAPAPPPASEPGASCAGTHTRAQLVRRRARCLAGPEAGSLLSWSGGGPQDPKAGPPRGQLGGAARWVRGMGRAPCGASGSALPAGAMAPRPGAPRQARPRPESRAALAPRGTCTTGGTGVTPPPPPFVLIGHAASLTPY
jgi:hypothetical protein